MDRVNYNIAIDGPSGAGKSTIARIIARELGFMYVDTGALYRTVGYYIHMCGIGSRDRDGVKRLLDDINIELAYDSDGTQRMILNGQDVTDEIRRPEISIYASDISAMPFVRNYLLEIQRELTKKYPVIMDGRDIGTVVLPNADLKIYLTALAEERARRRFEELDIAGVEATYEKVLEDINYRDHNDMSRKTAPLRCAEDAVQIDTTGNTLEQSVEQIQTLIKERLGL